MTIPNKDTREYAFIIPTFNRKKYIQKCIESILQQKYDLSKIEIVVVDDGGSDGTNYLMQEYIEKCNAFDKFINSGIKNLRLLYIKTRNRGVSSARNTGIKNADSKYVIFIDDDCFVNSDFLYKLSKRIDEHKNETKLVIQPNLKNPINGNVYGKLWEYTFRETIKEDIKKHGKNRVNTLGGVFITNLPFIKRKLFDSGLKKSQEDKDLKLRLNTDIIFYDDLVVYHNPRDNIISFFKQRFSYGAGAEFLDRKWGKKKTFKPMNIYQLLTIFVLVKKYGFLGFRMWLLMKLTFITSKAGRNSVKMNLDKGHGINLFLQIIVFVLTAITIPFIFFYAYCKKKYRELIHRIVRLLLASCKLF